MAEQQIIQNPSITPGALKIELSGGYVTAISGHPVGGTGGGGPSVVYTGVAGEINVNNQQGTIGLADAIKEQLSSIPSKVSDLSDSANYYTKEQVDHEIDIIDYTQIGGLVGQLDSKQDKLTFGYDDSAISSINGSAIAGQNDMSQYALKNDLDVVSGEVDILTDTSAKWNEVSAKFDTSSWNAYSGKFQLSGDYATKSDLDLYYKKTETSSKDEISDAIKDFITDADVTAKNYLTQASGDLLYVPIPKGLSDGQYYAMTTSSWKVIQGAGDVSGISTVAHDDTLTGNGNNENMGVNTTKIQEKLTDAQIQNINDVTTLKTASSTWNNVSAKLNTSDFNTFTATTAPATYQPKGDYLSANALTNYYTKSETSGAEEISTALGDKVDKPNTSLQNKYLALRTNNDGSVSGWTDILDKVYSKSEADGTFQKKTDMGSYLTTEQYATDSATFVTETELETVSGEITALIPTNYVTSGNYISGNDQYALTTAGWSKIQHQTEIEAGSGLDLINDVISAKLGTDLAFDEQGKIKINTNGTAAGNLAFVEGDSTYATSTAHAEGYHTTALNNAHAEGNFTYASGYGAHAEGFHTSAYGLGVRAAGAYTLFSADGDFAGRGVAVEGYANLTTAHPLSANGYVHGGVLKVIGNGAGDSKGITGSDALILYRDGTLSAAGGIYAGGGIYGDGDGTYIPYTAIDLPIGSANTANNYAAAIGYHNSSTNLGFAVGSANSARNRSMAFGIGNIADDISLAIGYANTASGTNPSNSAVNIAIGYQNSAIDHAAAMINLCTAHLYSFAAGNQCSADEHSVSMGWANTATNSSVSLIESCQANSRSMSVGHSNTADFYSYCFGRGLRMSGESSNTTTGIGGLVVGGWNKTSANAVFVIGNGTGNGNSRSDALVVDRSGNTKINGSLTVDISSGNNVIAVASAASLIGASRQTSANYGQNNNAMGTTWMGVGGPGMYRGFLKYTQGGNVGALDSDNTIQIEFTPTNKGSIFAVAKNNGTDCPETQILNPTKSSCDAMATSANANLVSGPNYMLAKNADGQFVIGAAFVNTTSMDAVTLAANTYYFVYEN